MIPAAATAATAATAFVQKSPAWVWPVTIGVALGGLAIVALVANAGIAQGRGLIHELKGPLNTIESGGVLGLITGSGKGLFG